MNKYDSIPIEILGDAHETTSLNRALERLKQRIYYKICDLNMTVYKSKEPLEFENRFNGEKSEINVGERWGGLFDCAWFHIQGEVPQSGDGIPLVYVIDINGEGLIFDNDGCPYRGITNVNTQFDRTHGLPGKRIVRYTDCGKKGDKIDFWMDAGCNDLFGNYCSGTVKELFLAGCNYTARELYYDCFVLLDLMKNIPPHEPYRYELMTTLIKIRDALVDYTPEEYEYCLRLTKEQLSKENGYSSCKITAIGNAHIDLAWLWPIRETKRKGARTFSTALENMDRYPDYKFGASQGQLYQWTKENYPKLFEKIKKQIENGRWELMGAMWIESDTNVPSGESLIRQMLYGNAYYEKEFGKRCNYVWLPDTFGYSAALPQIIKKCGLDCFLTIKLSWNKYTAFPYTSFIWKGIDGTGIMTHMPPEGNYLSAAAPTSLSNASKGMAGKQQFGDALLPFGIGDGGGGPSPCHLEYLSREKNLCGLPPVKQAFVSDFVNELSKTKNSLPIYDGELYLECHLATYTTQGKIKRYNRLMEKKLRSAEMLSALAMRTCGFSYPQEKLEEIWKEVLLYQFHDILPGSSINRVYEEAYERYEILLNEIDEIIDTALKALAENIDTTGYTAPKVVFNTLSFDRNVWIETENGYSNVDLPSIGYSVIETADVSDTNESFSSLENDFLSVEFDENTGAITSIYNKQLKKELLSAPSNLMLIYDDMGDAWEVEHEYLFKKPIPAKFEGSSFEVKGPVKKVIQKYSYGSSAFEVEISLTNGAKRLEFHVTADWNADGRMLRIRFEHTVAADKVDCDIQFGHISRTTHNNTTAEKAQYEVCAHKWIRESEYGLSFNMLSECKYGFRAKDNVIEMNCLRSSNHPSHHMEAGHHEFSYAVFADDNTNGCVSVVKEGYDFNYEPLIVGTDVHGGKLKNRASFISVDNPSVIIETVKKKEIGDEIIVRSYEAAGATAEASMEYGFENCGAKLCNMDETGGTNVDTVNYHRFEIQTISI